MEETQKILEQMGFKRTQPDVNRWISEWFGSFILLKHATPHDLAQFIYHRGACFPDKDPLKID